MGEPPSLLQNTLRGTSKWIKVTLQGTQANRSAIGATVTIEAAGVRQTLPLLGQSSFLSQNERRLHFGLGTAAKVDKVTVRWPAGASETFPGGPAGTTLHLKQGAGQP
ncbi:MAG: ASPIC/UnbV domain-containing protein [Bryobacterales bacterium]|nr:ASPIC/UnbV domain-containing protein [Bryobacterales bacterium]